MVVAVLIVLSARSLPLSFRTGMGFLLMVRSSSLDLRPHLIRPSSISSSFGTGRRFLLIVRSSSLDIRAHLTRSSSLSSSLGTGTAFRLMVRSSSLDLRVHLIRSSCLPSIDKVSPCGRCGLTGGATSTGFSIRTERPRDGARLSPVPFDRPLSIPCDKTNPFFSLHCTSPRALPTLPPLHSAFKFSLSSPTLAFLRSALTALTSSPDPFPLEPGTHPSSTNCTIPAAPLRPLRATTLNASNAS